MRIKALTLKNFKRFTDLSVKDIPEDSKLVLLIGANGSGKSCILDAFGFINNRIKGDAENQLEYLSYFKKDATQPISIQLLLHDYPPTVLTDKSVVGVLPKHSFYGRTSFRQVPRLTRTSLGQSRVNIEADSDRPKFFIDKDMRFENDLEKITEIILKDLFRANQTNAAIKEKYIAPINKALASIFGDHPHTHLELVEIIPPLDGKVAQVTFKKGSSEIHYNYLSAGEKEVFNLLINLISRGNLYQNTIFYYDEIDLHLNTKVQYNLLKEIVENWIPATCQFWSATHSLGFIEYAKQYPQGTIIDFDALDFDSPQVLTPAPKDNADVYEIAVSKDMLPALFQNKNIVFVENKDRLYYANCNIENTLFISENNRNNVYQKVRTTQYKGIVDRDFLSDDDIAQIRQAYPNLYILDYYSIENYLYHPDNLADYHAQRNQSFDKELYRQRLKDEKNIVKHSIIPSLSMKRLGYPYFGEPNYHDNLLQKRFKPEQPNIDQSTAVAEYLQSDELEMFYKSLPMKDYCTQLPERQNISKQALSKTSWFTQKIAELLQ